MNVHAADLTGFDWLLVVIVLLSIVRAAMRGVVQALFGLLGFVGGFELANWNYVAAGNWMFGQGWFKSYPVAHVVAFLTIAIAVAVVFDLVGRGVKRTAHVIGFGTLDRLLGACFGLARGLLLGVAVVVAARAFVPSSPWVAGSVLSNYFLGAAHAVSFVVPQNFH